MVNRSKIYSVLNNTYRISMNKKLAAFTAALFMISAGLFAQKGFKKVTISSMKELAAVAAGSNQQVTMLPGVYKMGDYLTPAVIKNTPLDAIGRAAMITFSGNNNTFDFTGVTIEVDTRLLAAFKKRSSEFYLTGKNIHLKGLTVTDIGNFPTASGGHSMTVAGDNNKIENVTLNVSGSSPYGYGDLLGKGGRSLAKLQKHSGMCIEGLNDTIVGCKIYSKAFGHCFFVQGGRNVYFKDCYAEAQIRTTDDMLAETSGPAFASNFSSVYKNRQGKNVITPGYTKSLSECGFRMYGTGGVAGIKTGAVTAVNCKAKNTRIGFAFMNVEDGEVLIKDCEAIGCEAGYNLTGVSVINSSGDAAIGPLLYLDGDNATVELSLLPATSASTVHAVACIAGSNHVVTLKNGTSSKREKLHPILLGVTTPAGTNGYSPTGTAKTTGITLNNLTGMPVEIGPNVSVSTIKSNGVVTDKGLQNSIAKVQ